MKAAKLARFWRGLTIFFTILFVIQTFFRVRDPSGIFFYMATIVLRVVAIYIVTQFISEADEFDMILPVVNAQPGLMARATGYQPEGVATMPPKYNDVVTDSEDE